jgi:hypothetical protein
VHYAELSALFDQHLKRPIRRPRRLGWESKLSPTEAVDLHRIRTEVDDLETEYERSSSEITLTSLMAAKIRLVRRTALLQRRVADSVLSVRSY